MRIETDSAAVEPEVRVARATDAGQDSRLAVLLDAAENQRAIDQTLKMLSISNSESLTDVDILARGHFAGVHKRLARRLWFGRSDSIVNYDPSSDRAFIEERSSRSSCTCENGSCCNDAARTEVERLDCLDVSHATMRINLKQDTAAREEETKNQRAIDQAFNKLAYSNQASLKDLDILAREHDDGAFRRLLRRLWAGRSDSVVNYDPSSDRTFIDERSSRFSCTCENGSCSSDAARSESERLDCLEVSQATMRIGLKEVTTVREEKTKNQRALDQTFKKLSNSNSASLKDLYILSRGHDDGVHKRVVRRLWTGRSESFVNYDPSSDRAFIDERSSRFSCTCKNGSCSFDTARSESERIDCLGVSQARMRIDLKQDTTAREQNTKTQRAIGQTFNKLHNSNLASVKDADILARGHDTEVYKRLARRLWAGRSDSLVNYDPSSDRTFIDERSSRFSCTCENGSCSFDAARTESERTDCLEVSHARMRVGLKQEAAAREQLRVARAARHDVPAGMVQEKRLAAMRQQTQQRKRAKLLAAQLVNNEEVVQSVTL